MFRYKCTIFRENRIPVVRTNCRWKAATDVINNSLQWQLDIKTDILFSLKMVHLYRNMQLYRLCLTGVNNEAATDRITLYRTTSKS